MARASKDVLRAACIGFGVPALLLILAILFFLPKDGDMPLPEDSESGTVATTQQSIHAPRQPISVLIEGQVRQLDIETYVVRVVLAEMPASFDLEALKAQAVASRTYALRTCADGQKHEGAVCTSYRCCQAYMTEEAYLQRGWDPDNIARVQAAVYATAGQVLVHDGQWIRSTYFACSGGCTEAAVTVWGKDYPYLQSVKSPGEEETVYYTDTARFTPEQFQEALGVGLSGEAHTWFGAITYTQSGGVETLVIGGVAYRGTTLRTLLSLRSTIFEVVVTDSEIIFVTKGYGHRVGMSQYGAEAMALEGCDYRQILHYYYKDVEIMENYQKSS